MNTNISPLQAAEQISSILGAISPAPRLAILLAIGDGEACVCHLEAVLGKRQAYISQNLMALRQAEILLDRREGRFIYYRIANPALLHLIRDAGRLAGVVISTPVSEVLCECPHCTEKQPGFVALSQIG